MTERMRKRNKYRFNIYRFIIWCSFLWRL